MEKEGGDRKGEGKRGKEMKLAYHSNLTKNGGRNRDMLLLRQVRA